MLFGSKKIVYRIIAIAACIVLVAIEILHYNWYRSGERVPGVYEIVTDAANVFCFFMFAVLIFYPQKIELFGGLAFLYSYMAVFFEPTNALSVLMLLLGITTLFLRGFMKNHGKLKSIILVALYVVILFTELRFGFRTFLSSILQKTGFFLTTVVIYIFLEEYLKSVYLSPHNKFIDLTQFDLSERDKEWIKLILNNEKYDYIAKIYNLNSGTVKNNCHRIYKILKVSDRQDFITKYAGFRFLFDEKDVAEFKEEQRQKGIVQ